MPTLSWTHYLLCFKQIYQPRYHTFSQLLALFCNQKVSSTSMITPRSTFWPLGLPLGPTFGSPGSFSSSTLAPIAAGMGASLLLRGPLERPCCRFRALATETTQFAYPKSVKPCPSSLKHTQKQLHFLKPPLPKSKRENTKISKWGVLPLNPPLYYGL